MNSAMPKELSNVMKSLFVLTLGLLFATAYGCASPASQAVKRGDELLTSKNYYGASQEYLTALNLEAAHKEAKMKLCQTAKQGYDQKLEMADTYEKSADFESAMPQYAALATFIDKTNSYNCLSFAPINAKQKIAEMKSGASEKYYNEAEKSFANSDYVNSIKNYQEALKHNNPYKDCKEKIAESYYRTATKAENQKSFRDAANSYSKANESISGYKDASGKATSLFYALGLSFLQQQLCRNSYEDLSRASKLNSDFKDLSSKITEAEACAISKIAFTRFDNPTGKNISGMSIGDVIFDEIKTKLQNRSSQFIRTMERDELNTVLGEQSLGASGVTDDYAAFKQLKGVHYLIIGKLTQVKVDEPAAKVENMKDTGSYSYKCTEYSRKGTPYEATCSKDIPIYFHQHSAKLNVALTGSIKVISVATGEQLIFHSIGAARSDSITYAAITSEVGSNVSIPSGLQELTSARQELKDKDVMVKEMISEISDAMVQKILEKIDKTKTVADPVELAMLR